MRIVLMPSNYAPAVGGVEVLTARLARQLMLRGHAVEVWAPRSDGDALPVREVIDGVVVRRFVFAMPRANAGAVARLPLAGSRTSLRLRSAARDFRPDLLHVQCFSANGAYATALSTLLRLPLVITLQGETVMDDHDIYDRSTTLRTALRLGLRRAVAVTGCSQFTLDDAHRRFGLRAAKASVIFNGVDLDEVTPSDLSTGAAAPFERYVLAMGRVVKKKGFDLLLDAFAGVAGQMPSVGLVIGGDGAELTALKAQAQARGIEDRVHFPGRLDRTRVAALMQAATAFVMPSRVEPFGIVALEAWRANTPLVVTSHGGPPEFVADGVDGLVVAPEDTAALGAALLRLLSDDGGRKDLAVQGAAAVQRFTWTRICEEYEALYERVVLRTGSPRRAQDR